MPFPARSPFQILELGINGTFLMRKCGVSSLFCMMCIPHLRAHSLLMPIGKTFIDKSLKRHVPCLILSAVLANPGTTRILELLVHGVLRLWFYSRNLDHGSLNCMQMFLPVLSAYPNNILDNPYPTIKSLSPHKEFHPQII